MTLTMTEENDLGTSQDRFRYYLSLRKTNPARISELLAFNCVKRGRRWLNANAPNLGWWRQCLNGSRSRIQMKYSDESVLAIVFEYDRRFADEFGYVQEWKV